MEALIKKAAVLIEALPYIQTFRDEIVVVKMGGSAMEDPAHVEGVLTDVIFMECVGMKPVIVHGGGKAISRSMRKAGIEPRFLHGLRITCEKAIAVVEQVITGEVNPALVSILETRGGRAQGLHGNEIFTVTRKSDTNAASGKTIDWGFVGEPSAVDTGPILKLLADRIIPVITPLGIGPDGKTHNINADVAAAATAKALKARKLAFLSDVPGLLRDQEDPTSLLATLHIRDVEDLIRKGVIAGGMLPKVQSGIEALRAGVRKVHLIDGRLLHSLLLEIFTDKGVGTEIINNE